MIIAHRTILIALALAGPLAARAQTADPLPAIVEGTVINIQNSRTIPRATVTLLRSRQHGKSTRADGNGHFIFKNVEPGIYRLTAARQGFFSDARKREYQPMFEVASGDHVKNMPVRLMPAAIMNGEVVDEFNDPVQNVEIRLLSTRMQLGQMVLAPAGKAVTDDRGQYRIAGLHPGKYYLVAEYKHGNPVADAVRTQTAEQIAAATSSASRSRRGQDVEPVFQPDVADPAFTYPPLFYPSTGDFQQAQAIALNAGDEVAANFLLISAPVVSIRGRVSNGMTGEPAGNAAVSAYWTTYMEGDGLPAHVVPEDGRFEIRGVAPGMYTLRASVTADGQNYTGELTVEVGNEGAQNVQISVLPDFAATGHVSVAGLPRNPLGRVVIEFAGEGLMPRVRASAVNPEFKFDAQLRPDRRYHAIVRNLPENYYLKYLSLSGHEVTPDNVVVSGKRGDIELVLSPAGAHIEGYLFDTQGQPTRGSILLVPDVPEPGPPDLFRRTSADSKGKFTLRGIAPGSYRLLAMESVNLDGEINDPDYLRTIGSRGEGLMVEESGNYTVSLKLDSTENH